MNFFHLQCLLQVVVLNCQSEGDLGKDSSRLYMYSKECCEALGRIYSEEKYCCVFSMLLPHQLRVDSIIFL